MLRIIGSQLVGFLTTVVAVLALDLLARAALGIPLGVRDLQWWPRAWYSAMIPVEFVAAAVGAMAACLTSGRRRTRYALVAALPGLLSSLFGLWPDLDYRWLAIAVALCSIAGALTGA